MTLRNEKPHVNKGFSPHTRGCSALGIWQPELRKVFPAYAGMFPWPPLWCSFRRRFPRIRGDVPAALKPVPPSSRVFPAYAGMFLKLNPQHDKVSCFPRIRGDVPKTRAKESAESSFSPHTRGCSVAPERRPMMLLVFPAYAGMFPMPGAADNTCHSFPRIRGDVPILSLFTIPPSWFSPHTRGCSAISAVAPLVGEVFPAYAGMFPGTHTPSGRCLSFPRIRGDVPRRPRGGFRGLKFSPHTRGCSFWWNQNLTLRKVFPAYAGMFPGCHPATAQPRGFPRIRGDVPSAMAISR